MRDEQRIQGAATLLQRFVRDLYFWPPLLRSVFLAPPVDTFAPRAAAPTCSMASMSDGQGLLERYLEDRIFFSLFYFSSVDASSRSVSFPDLLLSCAALASHDST